MRSPASDALSNLRSIGLAEDLPEATANATWAELLIVDGRYWQGDFAGDYDHLIAAYHTIAKSIIRANSSDQILEEMIPHMVEQFRILKKWRPHMSFATLKLILHGPVNEWKGRRLLMPAARHSQVAAVRKKQRAPSKQPRTKPKASAAEIQARARQAVVMPILEKKGWTRGKWISKAGVSKNSGYDYLKGKRSLSDENRLALAQELEIKPEQLPN